MDGFWEVIDRQLEALKTATSADVEVEYREIPHYYSGANAAGRPWKRYEVVVGGEVVGTIADMLGFTLAERVA